MMKRILSLCSLSLLLFSSCNRDSDALFPGPLDTIKPKPYLPIYPGSWWKYVDANGDTVLQTTGAHYVRDTLCWREPDGIHFTKPSYVPVWNGKPTWGYTQQGHTGSIEGTLYYTADVLRETVGGQWTVEYSQGDPRWETPGIVRDVMATGLTMNVDSLSFTDVIKVRESSFYPRYLYYARDVGLIKTEKVIANYQVVDDLKLVSWYIHP
jgi:hypothetical protein